MDYDRASFHPPIPVRINGALSNFKEFAEAFDCPIDSPMNPKDKCDMWDKPESTAKHFLNNLI